MQYLGVHVVLQRDDLLARY